MPGLAFSRRGHLESGLCSTSEENTPQRTLPSRQGEADEIDYMVAGQRLYVFRQAGPLWYAAITGAEHHPADVRRMLDLLGHQITSLLTGGARASGGRPTGLLRRFRIPAVGVATAEFPPSP